MHESSVEFKAYCDRPVEHVIAALKELGASHVKTGSQTDTYFNTRHGRLKLRVDDADPPGRGTLIFYDRADAPAPRESRHQIVPLGASAVEAGAALTAALGVRGSVRKVRHVYQRGAARLTLDEVDGLGRFVEVEIDSAAAGGVAAAHAGAQTLLASLGLSLAEIVPWSYVDLQSMLKSAAVWRQKRAASPGAGTLFLLDGASCSGKSTLVNRIRRDAGLAIDLVPRYSTRARRKDDDGSGGEYIFTSHEAFRDLAFSGGFIEYRDFQFGMSYGLPWQEAFAPLLAGRHAIGIINLGNVRHVKAVLPEAVTILVDASQETIRQRLISRGVNTPEQIEERLANAARVQTYRALYDYVVTNEDGTLRDAENVLRDLIIRGTQPKAELKT